MLVTNILFQESFGKLIKYELSNTQTPTFIYPTSCSDTQMMPEDTILRLWSSSSLQLCSCSFWSPDRAWMSSRLARSTITIHLSSRLLGTASGRRRRHNLNNSHMAQTAKMSVVMHYFNLTIWLTSTLTLLPIVCIKRINETKNKLVVSTLFN